MYRYSYVTQADNEIEQLLSLSHSLSKTPILTSCWGFSMFLKKKNTLYPTPTLYFLFFLLELEIHFEKVSKDASSDCNQWEPAWPNVYLACVTWGQPPFQVGMYNSSDFKQKHRRRCTRASESAVCLKHSCGLCGLPLLLFVFFLFKA